MTIEMNPIATNRNGNVKPPRYDFSKIRTAVRIPNLIEVQRESYDRFLQMDLLPPERDLVGLQAVFRSTFPISDFRETSSLEFVEFRLGNWQCKCGQMQGLHHLRSNCRQCGSVIKINPLSSDDIICGQCGTYNRNIVNTCDNCGEPVGLKHKYDVHECQERGMTYSVPLHVKIRLTVWDKDEETAQKSIRYIKEEEVYFGDLPLMTENGTFIINGTERVIVSQLHRSPGVFFEKAQNNTYFLAKIIPYRGSWVEFEYDAKNLLYVRIDRKRKFLATIFLRALGLRGADEIIRNFYTVDRLQFRDGSIYWAVNESLTGLRAAKDLKAGADVVTHAAGKKITNSAIAALRKANVEAIEISDAELEGAYAAADIVNAATGEVILEANEEVTPRVISMAQENSIDRIEVFFPERDDVGPIIATTLKKDPIHTHEESLIEIYRR